MGENGMKRCFGVGTKSRHFHHLMTSLDQLSLRALAGAEALGEAISSNHALQRLDLSNNGIKGAGGRLRVRKGEQNL